MLAKEKHQGNCEYGTTSQLSFQFGKHYTFLSFLQGIRNF